MRISAKSYHTIGRMGSYSHIFFDMDKDKDIIKVLQWELEETAVEANRRESKREESRNDMIISKKIENCFSFTKAL